MLFVLVTYFTFSFWLVGASALCFVALAFAVFFRSQSAWASGLVGGGVVLLTYAFHMPYWGRLWYGEDGAEDWRTFGLWIVIGLINTVCKYIQFV